MSNDLCSAADLSHLPGAPFTEKEVDGAVAEIQGAFGWHVAPETDATQTFTVRPMESRLRLATRHLVSVDEVRVDGVALAVTEYGAVKESNQVRKVNGWWPTGFDNIEVDYTHGFEECPLELLTLIAEAAATGRRDQAIKPYLLSFDQYETGLPQRFSLRYVPGLA
jgi:hypothetical protein